MNMLANSLTVAFVLACALHCVVSRPQASREPHSREIQDDIEDLRSLDEVQHSSDDEINSDLDERAAKYGCRNYGYCPLMTEHYYDLCKTQAMKDYCSPDPSMGPVEIGPSQWIALVERDACLHGIEGCPMYKSTGLRPLCEDLAKEKEGLCSVLFELDGCEAGKPACNMYFDQARKRCLFGAEKGMDSDFCQTLITNSEEIVKFARTRAEYLLDEEHDVHRNHVHPSRDEVADQSQFEIDEINRAHAHHVHESRDEVADQSQDEIDESHHGHAHHEQEHHGHAHHVHAARDENIDQSQDEENVDEAHHGHAHHEAEHHGHAHHVHDDDK